MNTEFPQKAHTASLLVAITLHFVKSRLVYFEKVLQSLASFPVRRCDIVVFTATPELYESRDARIKVMQALPDPACMDSPYAGTWAHKKLISGEFLEPNSPYSHFIYLEDDEQLTFENFMYFVVARETLRPFGLVPAFVRTEWDVARKCAVSVDSTSPIKLEKRPYISSGDYAFVASDYPYCGGYILDRELAQEYVASRSFDSKRSQEMSNWGVCERSSMGLTFENPPGGFSCRVVVPISTVSHNVPECARLVHLPNNYANNPNKPFGKIAMTELFTGNLEEKQ